MRSHQFFKKRDIFLKFDKGVLFGERILDNWNIVMSFGDVNVGPLGLHIYLV